MRLAVRVDASGAMGIGHVMRCLTLAQECRHQGAEATFFCREHPGNLLDFIRAQGFPAIGLPSPVGAPRGGSLYEQWLGVPWYQDARDTIEAMGSHAFDWLVVDHYALDARWEEALAPKVGRILAIDDLADRPHAVDLLLDQNRPEHTEAYAALCPKGCHRLLGPRYALLRREFLEARRAVQPRSGGVGRLLVFYGGVDATNETSKALRALQTLGRDWHVDVVIGATNPHRAEVERRVVDLKGAVLHVGSTEMARLMAQADLSLGAAGTATWERAGVGLPVVATVVAENQQEIGSEIVRCGLGQCLGEAAQVGEQDLVQALLDLEANPEKGHRYSAAGWALVDGQGAARVYQQMATAGEAP